MVAIERDYFEKLNTVQELQRSMGLDVFKDPDSYDKYTKFQSETNTLKVLKQQKIEPPKSYEETITEEELFRRVLEQRKE